MAAATDTGQASDVSCLQDMYEHGEWSDLSIVTATKTFKVHRSVVCPKNAALRNACHQDFRQSRPSTVHWEETAEVVDAMLRHHYGLPIAWLEEPYQFSVGPGRQHRIRSRGEDAAELIVAARKYEIERLGLMALRTFEF
ncbi:unnamed protein product [Zymoseptoria tritici ST99CH_1E4]|uniref:BTB domain-containing protein n=1 Tax=Zymoseptoria tritici ST99CH_1E4 TaxID=1276532 RepID=A0A2H1GMN0_ZYMTR|nr:unnamed protein product [Zymoseptoria tritici ST99CH_1E4]